MKLYHATTRANLPSILAQGLLMSKATGKEAAIWLHTRSRTHWAIAHTQKRHGVTLEEVIILEVNVSRTHLRRAWAGLWKYFANVSATSLTILGSGQDFAASPLE